MVGSKASNLWLRGAWLGVDWLVDTHTYLKCNSHSGGQRAQNWGTLGVSQRTGDFSVWVVLRSVTPRESGRGPKGPCRLHTGLKSSSPTWAGVWPPGFGSQGEGRFAQGEGDGQHLLNGCLKRSSLPWEQPSWEAGAEDSEGRTSSVAHREVPGPSEKSSSG